jgi:two-component system invasion response regulator UvrY
LLWVGPDAQNRVEVQGGIRIAKQAFDGGLRPRVLLAEDGEQERQLLKQLLQGEGIAVVGEASNGLEAVELARELEPDVVLMDLRMPGIGGLEAARMIVDSLSLTQVIVLTAYDGPLPTRSAQDAGAYAYLVKGCPVSLMKDVIEQAWHFNAGMKRRLQPDLRTGTLPPA